MFHFKKTKTFPIAVLTIEIRSHQQYKCDAGLYRMICCAKQFELLQKGKRDYLGKTIWGYRPQVAKCFPKPSIDSCLTLAEVENCTYMQTLSMLNSYLIGILITIYILFKITFLVIVIVAELIFLGDQSIK